MLESLGEVTDRFSFPVSDAGKRHQVPTGEETGLGLVQTLPNCSRKSPSWGPPALWAGIQHAEAPPDPVTLALQPSRAGADFL